MSKSGKIIFSIACVLIVFVLGLLIYFYYPVIAGAITGNKYLTSEQGQELYDKGYKDAFKNKDELESQVEYYKSLTDEYYTSVVNYQNEIKSLTNNNIVLESTISDLRQQKLLLENQVSELNSKSKADETEIAKLQAQINDYTRQIEDLTKQILNNTSSVSKLNNRIAELEKSIEYYENYIKTLESDIQVVVTFEFNGSVYNIQIINKNSKVSVVEPESTTYVIFNYWTVDGEKIDLNNYTFDKNTKVVADVTYKFDVKFMVDSSQHDSQIVTKGSFANKPQDPSKDGFVFDGWTLNGSDVVDVEKYSIDVSTIFYAKFSKLHTVTFMYENDIKSTQHIKNGEYASDVQVENTQYKVFNGWKINDVITDVSSYKIYTDTKFVADITYKFDVKFMVDGQLHNSQIIEQGKFAIVPDVPTKDSFKFVGWTINGEDVVDVSSYVINSTTTFIAKFKEDVKPGLEVYSIDGNFPLTGLQVWTDGTNTYYSDGTLNYVLDKQSNKWIDKTWNFGDKSVVLYGMRIWTMFGKVYYSDSHYGTWILKDNSNWEEITFSGCSSVDGQNVWTDGIDYYYSNELTTDFNFHHFKFNNEINTWIEISFNLNFYGNSVWSDGVNCYCSVENNYFNREITNYKFDKNNSAWNKVSFNISVYGEYVWTDGVNVYYSNSSDKTSSNDYTQLVFDKESNSWVSMNWNFPSGIEFSYNGECYLDCKGIWTDGEYYYLSYRNYQLGTYSICRFVGIGN